MGPAVPVPEPGADRSSPLGPGRVSGGEQEHVCRRTLPRREQAQGVPSAHRTDPSRIHVCHSHQVYQLTTLGQDIFLCNIFEVF